MLYPLVAGTVLQLSSASLYFRVLQVPWVLLYWRLTETEHIGRLECGSLEGGPVSSDGRPAALCLCM
jgi:hypothetical protein